MKHSSPRYKHQTSPGNTFLPHTVPSANLHPFTSGHTHGSTPQSTHQLAHSLHTYGRKHHQTPFQRTSLFGHPSHDNHPFVSGQTEQHRANPVPASSPPQPTTQKTPLHRHRPHPRLRLLIIQRQRTYTKHSHVQSSTYAPQSSHRQTDTAYVVVGSHDNHMFTRFHCRRPHTHSGHHTPPTRTEVGNPLHHPPVHQRKFLSVRGLRQIHADGQSLQTTLGWGESATAESGKLRHVRTSPCSAAPQCLLPRAGPADACQQHPPVDLPPSVLGRCSR